jgi:antitoxin (DNA-binding transcriptional repressor) of toxin-antitoxin stability system
VKFVYFTTMIKLNIHEAKTHLSKYLAKLKAGDRILLCRRNQPVAEITPLPEVPVRPRPIGLAKGKFTVPCSFFEPLPEELLLAFVGTHG